MGDTAVVWGKRARYGAAVGLTPTFASPPEHVTFGARAHGISPLCILASGINEGMVWPCTFLNSSSLTKKNNLSFLMGPPRLPPN